MYAAADLDGDGLQDIALVDFLTDSVKVMIAGAAGTFTPAEHFRRGVVLGPIVAADFNGNAPSTSLSVSSSPGCSRVLGSRQRPLRRASTRCRWPRNQLAGRAGRRRRFQERNRRGKWIVGRGAPAEERWGRVVSTSQRSSAVLAPSRSSRRHRWRRTAGPRCHRRARHRGARPCGSRNPHSSMPRSWRTPPASCWPRTLERRAGRQPRASPAGEDRRRWRWPRKPAQPLPRRSSWR